MSSLASSNSVFSNRIERLRASMKASGFDALAVNPGPSLLYLTGLQFHLMERPVVAIFPVSGTPAIVFPDFEGSKLDGAEFEIDQFPYTENLKTWSAAFKRAADHLQLSGAKIGVEPRSLRVLELRFLEEAAPGAKFISDETTVSALRARKDSAELALMKEATRIAQVALQETLPIIREGVTERAVAAELTAQMLRAGSDSELPFPPIIAFGPNSANPHAVPTDRKLARGELVLFDWGAAMNGYFSDLTRVYSLGEPDPELDRIARIVEEANRAGFEAAKPGVRAGDVDKAARSVIEKAGYGEYFIHRTGHGLGLEGHEEPYIRGDNDVILEPGMTFTIEPGIYLKGRGGVRIEDDVVITENGAESLSDADRSLIRL